jgi:hypothetical protein
MNGRQQCQGKTEAHIAVQSLPYVKMKANHVTPQENYANVSAKMALAVSMSATLTLQH